MDRAVEMAGPEDVADQTLIRGLIPQVRLFVRDSNADLGQLFGAD
jgi:hypothetical protein